MSSSQLASWGTAWDNTYGLRGRIIVAGAGGGSDDTAGALSGSRGVAGYTNANVYIAASAGGLWSVTSSHSSGSSSGNNAGATQVSAGLYTNNSYTLDNDQKGGFGFGNQKYHKSDAGGGSGYWGSSCADLVGLGGSSFISGHRGCVAIASAAGTTASTAGSANSVERATHYSGLKFSNTKMIDGAGYAWTTAKGSAETMPTPPGGTISGGNVGNGYCRITGTSATP